MNFQHVPAAHDYGRMLKGDTTALPTVKESRDTPEWQGWQAILAFRNRYGVWPPPTFPLMRPLLLRLRKGIERRLDKGIFPAALLAEARREKLLHPTGKKGMGALGRVILDLTEQQASWSGDVNDLRALYREGRLSKAAYGQLKNLGLDVAV